MSSASGRVLTTEEGAKLASDTVLVSEFKQRKLELEAQKNWDKFYKRNETRFFKDRHWIGRELEQLCPDLNFANPLTILEAGCGVGNFIFPFLDQYPSCSAYACDFSPRAVQFVKEHPSYSEGRCKAFECDLTLNDGERSLPVNVAEQSIDLCSLVFVLSAIHPDKMTAALNSIYKVLRPGASVVFRDYALYDQAMLRFDKGHKLAENFYVRQDGTRAYYFSKEKLQSLVVDCKMEMISCDYVQRETVNKKKDLSVPRYFIQARFRRPACD